MVLIISKMNDFGVENPTLSAIYCCEWVTGLTS